MSTTHVASHGRPRWLAHTGILFLGWLIPGGAHWALQRRVQAVIIFLVIHFMFFYGLYLGSGIYRYDPTAPVRSTLEKAAQMGSGLVYWFTLWTVPGLEQWPEGTIRSFAERFQFGRGDRRHAWAEKGHAFTITAGLLNVLMVLKAHDLLMRQEIAQDHDEEEDTRERNPDDREKD